MMCWYGRHLGFFNLCSGGVTGSADDKKMDWSRVHNVLVGTNAIACKAAAQRAEQLGFVSLILSHDLCGEAREVYNLSLFAELL